MLSRVPCAIEQVLSSCLFYYIVVCVCQFQSSNLPFCPIIFWLFKNVLTFPCPEMTVSLICVVMLMLLVEIWE